MNKTGFLFLFLFVSTSAAQSSLTDIASAAKIQKELAAKCRDYRKTLNLNGTRKHLIQDAKKYKGLKFEWRKGSDASMEYKGLHMGILPSECEGPNEPPVDKL